MRCGNGRCGGLVKARGSAGAFSEVGDVDGKWKKGPDNRPFSLRCGSGSQRQRFRFRVFRQPLSPAPAALRPATCPAWCGARWRRPALRPTLCRSGSAVRLHTDRGRNLRPDRRGRWHRRDQLALAAVGAGIAARRGFRQPAVRTAQFGCVAVAIAADVTARQRGVLVHAGPQPG